MNDQQDPRITEGLQKAAGAASEAAKMGKAAAMIAKGAATGGPGGAALAALKNPKASMKLIAIAVVIIILPILLIAMLPLIIFGAVAGFVSGVLSSIGAFFQSIPIIGAMMIGIGALFGGGATAEDEAARIYFDNAFDTAHIIYNLEQAHSIIGNAHVEQYEAVIARINNEIQLIPEGDEARIIGIEGDVFQFNTSMVLGLYAASLHDDVMQISLDDLRDAVRRADATGDLFDFIVEIELEERLVYPDESLPLEVVQSLDALDALDAPYAFDTSYISDISDASNTSDISDASNISDVSVAQDTTDTTDTSPIEIIVTIQNFIVVYTGEMIFAEIFGIADDNRLMTFAHEYARNLMTLLTDTDMGGWFGIILEAGEVDGFYSPFPGMDWRISSPFGWRDNPFGTGGREFHNGIDIPKPIGTPIRSIADGYVILAQFSRGAGNWIQIDHGYIPGWGYVVSEYMHNSRNLVSVTDPRTKVYAGQVIAEVGSTGRSTGPHLHLGVRVNGSNVNPTSFIGAPP